MLKDIFELKYEIEMLFLQEYKQILYITLISIDLKYTLLILLCPSVHHQVPLDDKH